MGPPLKASAYICGEAWSAVMVDRPTDRRMLIAGAAGFIPGALDGHRAVVVHLGVGQLGLQPYRYLVDYWSETMRAVGASTVVLTHWDDFFRPLTKPLRHRALCRRRPERDNADFRRACGDRRRRTAPADGVAP